MIFSVAWEAILEVLLLIWCRVASYTAVAGDDSENVLAASVYEIYLDLASWTRCSLGPLGATTHCFSKNSRRRDSSHNISWAEVYWSYVHKEAIFQLEATKSLECLGTGTFNVVEFELGTRMILCPMRSKICRLCWMNHQTGWLESRRRQASYYLVALGEVLHSETCRGSKRVTRFVQRLKHSMLFWLVIMVPQYGILEMTKQIEEQDFGVRMGRLSECGV